MKDIIIAGNWKMYKNLSETIDFFTSLDTKIKETQFKRIKTVVCVPSILLETAQKYKSNSFIGAQNIYQKEEGAYTGEISAGMLKSFNIDYCIIGHSERRQYFSETDATVREKYLLLKKYEIKPIICIGETLEQRENAETLAVIDRQLSGIFADIALTADDYISIAYEPVWAIVTGKTATPEMAQEVHAYIRKWLTDRYGIEIASNIPILYGGSVKPNNIKELLNQEDIDGGLIGGASLNPQDFWDMINTAREIYE